MTQLSLTLKHSEPAVPGPAPHFPRPPISQRVVAVHLLSTAPACAGLAVGDRRRWRTFYGVDLAPALAAVLRRLERSADEVCVRGDDPPSFDIDLVATLNGVPGVPIATVIGGATADEVRGALETLRQLSQTS